MIGKLSLQSDRLLSILRKGIYDYCLKLRLPPIDVKYGAVSGVGGLEFKYKGLSVPHIAVHSSLSKYLLNRSELGRLHYLLEAVSHEVTHYGQYLKGIQFSESKAYSEGLKFANSEIGKFSREDVNPIKSSLYESFHGNPPKGVRKVFYNPPSSVEPLVKIGDLSEIRYRPTEPSQYSGTEFYHKSGDTGEQILKTNLILATDAKGENLYLVRDKDIKRPFFNDMGIIG